MAFQLGSLCLVVFAASFVPSYAVEWYLGMKLGFANEVVFAVGVDVVSVVKDLEVLALAGCWQFRLP